ncbi:hypothetical protein V2J09_012902 [Rumex salicifolius]
MHYCIACPDGDSVDSGAHGTNLAGGSGKWAKATHLNHGAGEVGEKGGGRGGVSGDLRVGGLVVEELLVGMEKTLHGDHFIISEAFSLEDAMEAGEAERRGGEGLKYTYCDNRVSSNNGNNISTGDDSRAKTLHLCLYGVDDVVASDGALYSYVDKAIMEMQAKQGSSHASLVGDCSLHSGLDGGEYIRARGIVGSNSRLFQKHSDQLADVLTKALPRPKFQELISKIGLSQRSSILRENVVRRVLDWAWFPDKKDIVRRMFMPSPEDLVLCLSPSHFQSHQLHGMHIINEA